jgi:DNA recombination protein RmuC
MGIILIIAVLSSAVLSGVLVWMASSGRRQTTERLLQNALEERKKAEYALAEVQENIRTLHGETGALRSQLQYKEERLQEQKRELEGLSKKLESEFTVLADRIFEEKARKFSEQQESGLKNILEPLRHNIQSFKQEFDVRYNDETKERASLKEQIKGMLELNRTLSDQANNLTLALRGQVKQQGAWGEMILESILEYTGLKKDIHYSVQQVSKNADGRTIQPDVIVNYPGSRSIVIDAKVSLVHYEMYTHAATVVEQKDALGQLIRSVKNHIDMLSAKAYHDVAGSLDFVMMFVPLEAAYIAAMQADTSLWQYAYNKRVLIISPTNLVAAMKLVNDMWQRDAVNKQAHDIAIKAGRLYDKLAAFVDNMDKVGVQLSKAQEVWQEAHKQLSSGRGNLISQAEQMKELGAKAGKKISPIIVEQALANDGLIDEAATVEKSKPA